MSEHDLELIRTTLASGRAAMAASRAGMEPEEHRTAERRRDDEVLATLAQTNVSLMDAFLIMFDYLHWYWNDVGQPDALGNLLSELSLWSDGRGRRRPMDAAVFPQWLECAERVLAAAGMPGAYVGADIKLQRDLPEPI